MTNLLAPSKYKFIKIMLCTISVFVLQGQAFCQFGAGDSKRIDGRAKFIPLPYVNYDRSMGFMVGAVPMLMFNPVEKDTISPSSLIGGVGIWSTSKTWFVMGFGMFYFNEDRWRITTVGGGLLII